MVPGVHAERTTGARSKQGKRIVFAHPVTGPGNISVQDAVITSISLLEGGDYRPRSQVLYLYLSTALFFYPL